MKINTFLKKVGISLLLAVAVFSVSLALGTVTEAAVISGSCGTSAEYSLNDSGVLEITGSGNIRDYTVSDIPWLSRAAQINSLKLSAGITGIGINAFLGLDISPVSVPSSVITIGAHALGYTYDSGTGEYRQIDSFVIIGKSGSEAEKYAKTNGFSFHAQDSSFSGSCGENLFWSLDKDGALVISGSGYMTSAPWSKYAAKTDGVVITSVTLSSGVLSVSDNAFLGCRQLKSVSFPSGIELIGNSAFEDCTSLSSIVIPGTAEFVGENAFYGCTALSSVTLESGVVTLGPSSFSMTAVREVNIPSTVTTIGEKSFYSCESLNSVSMTGVTVVGAKAFAECKNLRAVSTGAALTEIGNGAFEGCSLLSGFAFGQSLVSIGQRAFYDCSSLTDVSLPASLTELGDFAFSGCSGIRLVNLGDGLVTVSAGAFEGCSNLSSVIFGSSVTTVMERAFTSCPELRSLSIPVSVRSIADNSIGFYYFEAPESSVSGAYTKYTGFTPEIIAYYPSAAEKYATDNNFTFTSLGLVPTDGGRLTDTAEWSINTSTGILTVQGTGAVPGYILFDETPWALFGSYITSVVYKSGIINVGSASFDGCSALTSVTLAGTVTEIGEEAFSGTNLTTVSLPKGLKSINDGAFSSCTSLSSVSLPDTLTTIGQYVFLGPNCLESIYVPESVGFIGSFSIGYDADYNPVKDFTIKGVKGSIAHNYAEINNIDFTENGYTEIKDTASGCTVSIIGADSTDYKLSFIMKSDSLAPDVFLADGETAKLYEILLKSGSEIITVEGTALISFPIPSDVSPLGIRIYSMADNGTFSEVEFTVESGRITFTYGSLGNFVITNADLSTLYNINVKYRFSDGTEALPPKIYRATPDAEYSIQYSFIDGYQPDVKTVTGKINGSDAEIIFTYTVGNASSGGTDTSKSTDPGRGSGAAKTILLIVEIILILGIIAAITILIILTRKKKNDGNGRISGSAPKASDKFADTIVVPDAPTRELDIQSLFADDPEEDQSAFAEQNNTNGNDDSKK